MFMKFSNFLFGEVYSSMVIHGRYIFLTYDSAGRERKNLQQLIKITNLTKIKQKFISTTLPQQLTLKNKVIHQTDKYMPRVISGHTKILLPVHHGIIVEYKLEYLLSFHMLFTWVKHQAVDININSLS